MLVAMAIGVIVLAGVVQLFASNRQTYRSIDTTSRLQENARFAMFFLARDIRNSDYWACIPVRGGLKEDTSYADGILGSNDESVSGLVDSDSITLSGAYGNGTNVVSVVNNTSDSVVTVGSTGDFSAGDVVVVGNCEAAQIATVNAKTTSSLTLDDALIRDFGVDASVYKVVAKRYFLGLGVSSNEPSLFVENDLNGDGDFADTGESSQELVEGIENLQILFGYDSDGDTAPDAYVDAETTGLDMGDVISVRVILVARSMENNVATTSRVYNSVTDRRFVKSFSSTVAIRNRLK